MTDIDRPTPDEIKRVSEDLVERGSQTLRQRGVEQVAKSIHQAVLVLLDQNSTIGRKLRQALIASSGLSREMIDWALKATFAEITAGSLIGCVASVANESERRIAVPARLVVTVLAGNVFTAGFRAVALPLLVGSPVFAKVSSSDDVFPRYFKSALDRVDQAIGSCYRLVRFRRENADLLAALFAKAEVVSLFGGDDTVQAIRKVVPPLTRLLIHGHGLGAVSIPASALTSRKRASEIAELVALDTAAYDQRGCLSPHVVCVEGGGAVDGTEFARLLAYQGLKPLSITLPRGNVPAADAAAQMQWRAVARVRGCLHEEKCFAVSYEGSEPLRPSPGFRNVGVYRYDDLGSLADRLSLFAVHLKALAVAGSDLDRERTARVLKPPLAPRISNVGVMQKPAFSVFADGQNDLRELLRWIVY
ncbi:MAG: hypothetical protein JXA30_10035 [Deltaproteobacteria bacterium]|nr:hypothetical protein [Deltaproteobacteria bacterium]